MAISNTARPSMRGLQSAFNNATNGVREQWDDFKSRHGSVRFLANQANKLGKTIQTKATHFGQDFTAAYHAFQASYKDRHMSSYLEQCREDLESAGFSVDATTDESKGFLDTWNKKREEAAAAKAAAEAAANETAANAADPQQDESLVEEPRSNPEDPAPAPDGPAASDIASAARGYSQQGIDGALRYLVSVLQEYESTPVDQRESTVLGQALKKVSQVENPAPEAEAKEKAKLVSEPRANESRAEDGAKLVANVEEKQESQEEEQLGGA